MPDTHYFKKYDSLKRFVTYFYQIDTVIKTNPSTVLEIGIGNKTVSDYLKRTGISVTACDFDKDLNPDVIADIRELPFKDNAFDTVFACQVLEHLPFSDFEKALLEMKRVSRKNVIISIPYAHYYLEAVVKFIFPFLERQIHFSVGLPFFKKKLDNNKEHYWEMGIKGYSKKRIQQVINKHFKTIKKFKPLLNINRFFYVLEK